MASVLLSPGVLQLLPPSRPAFPGLQWNKKSSRRGGSKEKQKTNFKPRCCQLVPAGLKGHMLGQESRKQKHWECERSKTLCLLLHSRKNKSVQKSVAVFLEAHSRGRTRQPWQPFHSTVFTLKKWNLSACEPFPEKSSENFSRRICFLKLLLFLKNYELC